MLLSLRKNGRRKREGTNNISKMRLLEKFESSMSAGVSELLIPPKLK